MAVNNFIVPRRNIDGFRMTGNIKVSNLDGTTGMFNAFIAAQMYGLTTCGLAYAQQVDCIANAMENLGIKNFEENGIMIDSKALKALRDTLPQYNPSN